MGRALDFRILGQLEVLRDGEALALGPPRRRALLALLVLRAGEPMSTERLVDELWPEHPPDSATKIVQIYVSELRKALGREAIATRAGAYVLDALPEQIDARRFERLAASGAAAEALTLWRGPALADFRYEPWAQAEIHRLEESRLATLEDRLDADLEAGRHSALVGELGVLVADNPLRERLRAQLILALYRSGRQAEALQAYRDARTALVEELGVEPGPELRRLEQAVLAQDTGLDAPTPSVVEPRRKTVTVLFVEPARPLDPEARFPELETAAAAVARHGGVAERSPGALVGVFGVPEVHEDDALRALRAAAELGAGFRAAVVTGDVVVGDARVADAVASLRPAESADPGEVVVSSATERLARAAATLEPRGRAFRLVEVTADARAIPRRLDAPLVGRGHELDLVREAFERAERNRTCTLVTVLGSAGIGKSRLAAELAAALRPRATVLSGHCVPYGEDLALRPLAEMVAQAGPLDEPLAEVDDAALVAERLEEALAGTAATQDVFWAARRLFEALARGRPLVLVLDDLHWAQPLLLDLFEHLAELVRDVPLLLLAFARPELLEERPAWGGGKPNALSTVLEPLSDDQSRALVADLGAELAADERERIAQTAEGNPLFIQELVAAAVEDPEAPEVPRSLQALLAARLDRLPPRELAVLQRAAVAGREVAPALLATLVEGDPSTAVDALVRKDLVRHTRDRELRFRHALIRDAAYASIPKARRAELHVRLAERLDRDELAGFHLERAFRYGEELGAPDRALASRAAERLAAAARRADIGAAATLFESAAALLEPGSTERALVLADLADTLRGLGRFDRAAELLDEAVQAKDERVAWRARAMRVGLALRTDPLLRAAELEAEADAAIAAFERLGDEQGLAVAWSFRSWIPWLRCQAGATVTAVQHAIDYARAVGDARVETRSVQTLLGAALWGPTPVTEARSLAQDIVSRGEAYPRLVVATAHRALAGLEAMAARFDEARVHVERERTLLGELGLPSALAYAAEVHSLVERLAGDPAAAAAIARSAYDVLAGDMSGPTLAAILARALVEEGRDDEALAVAYASRDAAAAEDLTTQVQWRGPAVRVLAARGAHAEALRLAEQAVEAAARTDFLSLRGDAHADLASVHAARGDEPAAAVARAEALTLYERKGNVAAAARLARSGAAGPGLRAS